MKVYLIKNSKGDYLQSHVGYFDYSKSKDAESMMVMNACLLPIFTEPVLGKRRIMLPN